MKTVQEGALREGIPSHKLTHLLREDFYPLSLETKARVAGAASNDTIAYRLSAMAADHALESFKQEQGQHAFVLPEDDQTTLGAITQRLPYSHWLTQRESSVDALNDILLGVLNKAVDDLQSGTNVEQATLAYATLFDGLQKRNMTGIKGPARDQHLHAIATYALTPEEEALLTPDAIAQYKHHLGQLDVINQGEMAAITAPPSTDIPGYVRGNAVLDAAVAHLPAQHHEYYKDYVAPLLSAAFPTQDPDSLYIRQEDLQQLQGIIAAGTGWGISNASQGEFQRQLVALQQRCHAASQHWQMTEKADYTEQFKQAQSELIYSKLEEREAAKPPVPAPNLHAFEDQQAVAHAMRFAQLAHRQQFAHLGVQEPNSPIVLRERKAAAAVEEQKAEAPTTWAERHPSRAEQMQQVDAAITTRPTADTPPPAPQQPPYQGHGLMGFLERRGWLEVLAPSPEGADKPQRGQTLHI